MSQIVTAVSSECDDLMRCSWLLMEGGQYGYQVVASRTVERRMMTPHTALGAGHSSNVLE